MGICMIFGAGERIPRERIGRACPALRSNDCEQREPLTKYSDVALRDDTDLVIAADGGMDWIYEELSELRPDIFIGDMGGGRIKNWLALTVSRSPLSV